MPRWISTAALLALISCAGRPGSPVQAHPTEPNELTTKDRAILARCAGGWSTGVRGDLSVAVSSSGGLQFSAAGNLENYGDIKRGFNVQRAERLKLFEEFVSCTQWFHSSPCTKALLSVCDRKHRPESSHAGCMEKMFDSHPDCAPPPPPPSAPLRSCADILSQDGSAKSGVYDVSLSGRAGRVFCDMETAGGGWTLVGVLDGEFGYCAADGAEELSLIATGAGKLSDATVEELLATNSAKRHVMYRTPKAATWADFSAHQWTTAGSSAVHLRTWNCEDRSAVSQQAGDENPGGCGFGMWGRAGNSNKLVLDSAISGGVHAGGLHVNAGNDPAHICGLSRQPAGATPVNVFVR